VPGGGDWLNWKRFAVLLGLFIFALFPGVLLGNQAFFFRDFGSFGYPLANYHRECFWRGEIPVWNNLSNCGLPYLAQWNTLTLYPLSLIYLLLPLPWSLDLFCLAHLFLAGMGMYVLAFRWTQNTTSAAVAGIGFACNGLMFNCLMWPNNIAGLAWMPWVIWAAEQGWEKGGRSLFLAAIVGAVQLLSGSPEIILFTALIIGAFWFSALLCTKSSKFPLLRRGLSIGGLSAALAAAQLLPFLDLLAHSDRNPNFGDGAWAIPRWGWMNLVLPLFKCYQTASGPCFQPKQGWTSSYYPGIVIVFLALLSFRFKIHKRAALLGVTALTGLVLALGDHAYVFTLFRKLLPGLGMMRFPVKFIVLALFALPLLAAFAVASLSSKEAPVCLKTAKSWMILLAALLTLIIGGALLYSCFDPNTYLKMGMLIQNGVLRIIWLLLAAAILLRLLRADTRSRQAMLQVALVLSLGLDAWTHAPNQNPTISPAMYAPNVVARELGITPASEAPRAFTSRRTHDLIYGAMVADSEKDFTGRRYSLFGNLNLLEHVPIADGFYSLYLPEQRQLWLHAFLATNFPGALGDFLAISRLSTNVFDWQPRASALPLVTIGMRPVFLKKAEEIPFLMSTDFNPRAVVCLPLEARSALKVINASQARLVNQTISASRLDLSVESSEPALVVLSQSYYHRWHAYVNEKPVNIWRANHAFQALEIPAGQSTIKIVYEDSALRWGSIVSILALLACMGGWFIAGRCSAPSPLLMPASPEQN
jgi:hypothetical protein